MRVNEYPNLVTNGDMSGNILSAVMPVTQGYVGFIQAVWTGAPIGVLQLLVSNDNNIYSLYTGSPTVVSGNGDWGWNLLSMGFNFIKVQYVFTSGTGTLNVTSSYKGN